MIAISSRKFLESNSLNSQRFVRLKAVTPTQHIILNYKVHLITSNTTGN